MAAKSITDPVTTRHAAIPPIAKALLAQALAWIVVQATFGEPAPVAFTLDGHGARENFEFPAQGAIA